MNHQKDNHDQHEELKERLGFYFFLNLNQILVFLFIMFLFYYEFY